MATINIGASNAGDEFYRYKMPAIQSKIEGRGNGIKTNIPNMVDVAKALARPASYTTKYFGCELGAQSKFEEKSGLAIVNGAHDAAKLAQLLEGFIKRFVQCFSCGNPETVIDISKKETIHLNCKACGAVSDVDMRHKLCTFIVKNPPERKKDKKDKQLRRAEKEREEEGAALDKAEEEEKRRRKEEKKRLKEEGGKKDKKDKKDKKKSKGEGDEANGNGATNGDAKEEESPDEEPEEEEDDDVVWNTDTSAAARAARAQEQLSSASAAMVETAVAEDEEKSTKKAADKMSKLAVADEEEEEEDDDDDDEEEDERISKLRGYAAKHDAKETAEYLVSDKLGVESQELGIHFLVEALLDEEKSTAQQLKSKKQYFIRACGADPKLQTALLCALELYVTETATQYFKQFSSILKVIYEEDIADEEVILAWGDNPKAAKKFGVDQKTGEAVRKQANAFLEWLKTADDDDDDDED